jgi:hypothetical protein
MRSQVEREDDARRPDFLCFLISAGSELANIGEWCARSKPMFCEQGIGTGVQISGGHAEYMAAYADATMLLPDGLDYEQAAPLFCAGYTVGPDCVGLSRSRANASPSSALAVSDILPCNMLRPLATSPATASCGCCMTGIRCVAPCTPGRPGARRRDLRKSPKKARLSHRRRTVKRPA